MSFLLENTPLLPEGFQYFASFLSQQEEQELLDEISKIELHTFVFQGFEAKRRVASFGYDYNFENRSLKKGKPIPDGFKKLIDKVAHTLSIQPEDFAELLITEYPVSSVINWHRDAPPFDIIAGISLISDCNFKFRPHEKTKQSRSSVLTYHVERRSLYVIDGPARSDWQHNISAVKKVRYSITLRTIRNK